MKIIGLIVNPVAGMGGRVGLKGSDGADILERARALGAVPEAPGRVVQALSVLARESAKCAILTWPGDMGEVEAREAGFEPEVIGSIEPGATSPDDTERAAREMVARSVDLLLFAGGDGTARNIFHAVGDAVPVLGIPAGVKIHSGVYAVTPRGAGEVAARFVTGGIGKFRDAEVMDIDEAAFREGRVSAKLYGYMRVPEENRFVQSVKAGGRRTERETLAGIAHDVVSQMQGDDERLYIIGPGTTTRAVMEALDLPNSLLGVDVVQAGKLIASDVIESELMALVADAPARIVVTVIGGQGHMFGRGNQQLSPRVLRAVGLKNITVIATQDKLVALDGRPLLVDTGDEDMNAALSGYARVVTGYHDYTMFRVGHDDAEG